MNLAITAKGSINYQKSERQQKPPGKQQQDSADDIVEQPAVCEEPLTDTLV